MHAKPYGKVNDSPGTNLPEPKVEVLVGRPSRVCGTVEVLLGQRAAGTLHGGEVEDLISKRANTLCTKAPTSITSDRGETSNALRLPVLPGAKRERVARQDG